MLIFANWGTYCLSKFYLDLIFAKISSREKNTQKQFSHVWRKVRSRSRRSTVADSSSKLAEPRGIPRGMRRDFGSNRGEFHARDYPRLFSPDVTNYFLRAACLREHLTRTKIQAMWDGHDWTVVRWSSSCTECRHVGIKFFDAHSQRFTAFLQRVFMD